MAAVISLPSYPAGWVLISTNVLGITIAAGQGYPIKPIRMVASGFGGGSGFTARSLAQEISGPLSQSVIAENRSGVIPGDIVSKAPADGHSILASRTSPLLAVNLLCSSHSTTTQNEVPMYS